MIGQGRRAAAYTLETKMARYKLIACHVLWRELCYFASLSENTFDFCILKQGLHSTPDILRKEVQSAIDSDDGKCDAILIGYGLCSNGIAGIVARGTKLVVMRGHDCITFLLGSRQRYREYFDAHPGTYWYSPGWIDTGSQPGKARYEKVYQAYIEKYGADNADYLMQMEQGWFKEYSFGAYIDLGIGDNSRYTDFAEECADWLGWDYDELQGDPQLVRDFVEGRWDSDAFLIVRPGQEIVASFDERVIKTGGSG